MSEQEQVIESDGPPRVSRMLVEARMAMGFSQKDVADQLFLTTTFIRYMDDGDFHLMTKTAYIKGYLRTYARVVGISGDEVVASYEEIIASRVEPVEIRDVTEEPVGANRFTGPVIQTGLIGLGALLLVVLLVWLFSSDDVDEQPRSADVQESNEVINSADDESVAPMRPLQLPERADVEQATADQTTADQTSIEPVVAESINAGVAVTANSVQQGRAVTAPAVNVERAVSAAATSSVATAGEVASENVEASAIDVTIEKRGDGQGSRITVTAVGEDKLEFDFSGECWVEITDADGESIYGDLNRAGDSLVVFGTAPFEVLFGKASAAKLQFNGKSFALSRYTSLDQTARVKLGR